jgi:CubicO group peptidase (beta-lactamase class C family)
MIRRLALCLALLFVPLEAGAAELQKDVRVRTALRILDAWLAGQQEYRGIPSLSLGVVHDQDLIWARSYGLADPESGARATPETVYRIASNSKPFTAIALMRLQEQGRLSLNDEVTRWVPELSKVEGGLFESRPITIANLLSHTSGLPREVNSPAWAEADFPEIAEVLEGLKKQRAIYGPATRLKYSNLAFTLAGLIIERAAGVAYDKFIRGLILEPLAMTHSGVDLPGPAAVRLLAVGYGRRMPDGSRKRLQYEPTRAMAPATGLYSSVTDLARFQAWQFRLLATEEPEILWPDNLRDMQRMHWTLPGGDRGWGLGFRVTRTIHGPIIGHGGLIHGFRSATGVLPADKIGLIVLASSDDGDTQNILNKVADLLIPPLREAAVEIKKSPQMQGHWERLTGLYRSRLGDLRIVIGDGKLVGVNITGSDPRGGLMRLKPLSEYEFRIDASYAGQPGEIARFSRDNKGRVERLYLGSHYLERIGD